MHGSMISYLSCHNAQTKTIVDLAEGDINNFWLLSVAYIH